MTSKKYFFMPIWNPRWLSIQYIVLTQYHLKNTKFVKDLPMIDSV
jgi:hypothetical protein